MLKLIKFIQLLLLGLFFLSCSLSDESVQNNINNTEISFSIPRLNPALIDSLSSSANSRAYLVSDKIKITVKQNGVIKKEAEYYVNVGYDPDCDEYLATSRITMTLPVGTGYQMYLESFNIKNSSTVATVEGVSQVFEIIDGVMTYISITMTPRNLKELSIGIEENLTPNIFTRILTNHWDPVLGEEFWFKIEAESNFTVINFQELLTISNQWGEHRVRPASPLVFRTDGSLVNSQDSLDNQYLFKTNIGEVYHIGLLPLAYDTGAEVIKSDTIKFTVDNYSDTNSSKEDAVPILLGETEGFFTGANDSDYYAIDLEPGKYYFDTYNLEAYIYNESGAIISTLPTGVNGVFEVNTQGKYYIKISSTDPDTGAFYRYTFDINCFSSLGSLESTSGLVEYETGDTDRVFLEFNPESSKEYLLTVKDYYSSDFTADVDTNAFNLTFDSVNNIFIKEPVCFSEYQYDPYYIYCIDSIANKKVYIEFTVFDKGTFAVDLNETIPIPTTGVIDSIITSNYLDGRIQHFEFDVSGIGELNFRGNSGAKYTIYSSDKSKFYLFDSDYTNSDIILDTGTESIIVRVQHHVYQPGSVNISLNTVP